jgi:hypothetical protein
VIEDKEEENQREGGIELEIMRTYEAIAMEMMAKETQGL